MSAINGDKGRYDRKRKARMHNREKMRAIRAEANASTAKPAAAKGK